MEKVLISCIPGKGGEQMIHARGAAHGKALVLRREETKAVENRLKIFGNKIFCYWQDGAEIGVTKINSKLNL